MSYKKITNYDIDEGNKVINLFLDNDTNPTTPTLNNNQFEIFSTLLTTHDHRNKNFDSSNSQLNINANLSDVYLTAYNLNLIPDEPNNRYGIVLSDKEGVANSIPVDNPLVILSISKVLSSMQ